MDGSNAGQTLLLTYFNLYNVTEKGNRPFF